MNAEQLKALISCTNFRGCAFTSPDDAWDLMKCLVLDYKDLADYRDLLYERGCFTDTELMAEFEKAETQMELYKLILAELPKYL